MRLMPRSYCVRWRWNKNAKREKLLYVLLEMEIFEELDGEGAVSGVAGKGRGLEGGRRYVSCDSCLRWGCAFFIFLFSLTMDGIY